MAEITITHTRAEGTILEGSSKGDGVFEIVREFGFWFSRNVDGLFIKRSRDKAADTWRINRAADALRAAGHTVTVEINERVRRSFEEAEADREERAENRADRFGDRASRAVASSDARHAAARSIMRGIPFGQPILVGHHSQRRAERDAERIDTNMRKSIEDRDRAAYWSDRARAAENYERFRKDPYRTLRRLKKLRADLRQQERYVAEAAEKGWNGERHEVNVLDLREEIEHWEKIVKQAEADGVKIWGPEDFAPGDYVHYCGSWYQAKRVNPTSLSIAWNLRLAPKQVMTLEDATERGRTWTHTADYTNVRARCPEAAMDAFRADGMVPGSKEAREASEAQPASAVREAQAAKPKTAKAAKRSNPKVAKRLFVTCDLGGTVAELTWLNGNSRPHKDFEPTLITPPEGEKFHRAVWSKALQKEIAKILDERGYAYGDDDWAVSRDRSGFVRSIEPKPEPEQPAEPAAAEEAPPPAVEEAPAEGQAAPAAETVSDEPEPTKTCGRADFKRGDYVEAGGQWHEVTRVNPRSVSVPGDPYLIQWDLVTGRRSAAEMAEAQALASAAAEDSAPAEDAPKATEGDPEGSEKTLLTCGFSNDTRNHTAPLNVVHSDSPLTAPTEEAAVTEEEKHGRRLTRRERHAAQMAEMTERASEQPEIERTAELDAAYRAYVDDGIASTDGWYSPLDFQAWSSTLGAHLVAEAAAEVPAAGEEKATLEVEAPAAEAEEVPATEAEESAEGAEKTPLPSDFSGNTRNHTASTGVVHSDYPLNPTTEEAPTMTTTAPAKKATATAKAAKNAAKTKPAPKKTTAKKADAPAPTPAEVKATPKRVPVDRIDRDPSQPREEFDQAKLEELAKSMKKLGQLQPVSLRYVPSTRRYVLIMGERRWRAAQMAGLTELDAMVTRGVEEGDRETLAKQVAENVGRADMTPMEEAKSFQRLVDAEYTIDEVAEMCGKSAAYVGWRIDLLQLCDEAQDALSKAHLPVGMAWYVSKLSCDNQMRFLAKYARGAFPNDRAAEEFVKACLAEEKRRESQGSFFVLADESAEGDGSTQEEIPGAHDVTAEERERIMDARARLTKKIDRLSTAGEILSELATADPEELALLLAGTPGGIPGHQMRMDHLAKLIGKVSANLRKAQAHAEVRASGIVINPEAAA
ncbi:ParB/RepB/Spo0J family partition protein [Streptomyces sp. NPDC051104]|uniref:ParB/RepB/Spo0J family partition protein n=1 Tax=Streptomyces sp. NPDC051104 TaxID=3155044 RepID=UPI00342E1920